MRKFDKNSAEKYIRQHERFKKWLAFALCVSILTGTLTLYMLNKPATAMTQEGAESIGLVLETADSEFEAGLIAQTQENKNSEVAGNGEDDTAQLQDQLENSDDSDDFKDFDDFEESDDFWDEEDEDEFADADAENEGGEVTDEAAAEDTEDLENTDSEENTETETSDTIELTADVVLTASYVDEYGDAVADDKEMHFATSLDFATEAPVFEGYEFKKASIDGKEISLITVCTDETTEYRYYEVTYKSEEVKSITEDTAVVLTYSSVADAETQSDVVLTATYKDKEDQQIAESQEIKLTKDKELSKDTAEVIEGYFYIGAFYQDSEIAKISPVFGADVSDASDASDDQEAVDNTEDETQAITGYNFTTVDGGSIEITEDAEITYSYVKASEETEFKFSDSQVAIRAIVNVPGAFPEGVEFTAAEVTASSEYNYEAYMDALNENAESIASDAGLENAMEYSENNTLMYDIAFMYEGKEIQPAEGSVSISMKFKDNQLSDSLLASSEEDITVVHLPIKEEVKESTEIASTAEATDISASDITVETLTDATAKIGDTDKVEFSSDNFSIFAVSVYQNQEPGTDTFETVLGDAINFGIVADTLSIHESETNFAVKVANTQKQFGNDLTNPVEQTFVAGVVNGTLQIKGEDAYFIVPKEYTGNITHVNETGGDHVSFDTAYTTKELNELVDDMMNYARSASADLATRAEVQKQNASFNRRYDENDKYVLDLTSKAAGTYYVTIDDRNLAALTKGDWLEINKKDDQTVVFNVTYSGTIELRKFKVNGVATDDGSVLKAPSNISKTIIFNFINSKDVVSEGSVAGVFIAGQPDAKWTNKATSAGWLVFPTVDIESGEWHNTYDQIKQISGTAQFQAYKTIDGAEADVSGFKFTLYKKGDNGDWTEIETVTNSETSPHNIIFNSITYGGDRNKSLSNYQYVSLSDVGQGSQTFVYKIKETAGTTDENGKAYMPDENEYYASVTVTHEYKNEFSKKGTFYKVSAPRYFADEACTQEITDRPTFNNKTLQGHAGILLKKYLNNGDPGSLKFSFTVRALMSDGYTLKTLTTDLTNDGSRISYDFKFDASYVYGGCIYLVITENDVTDRSSGMTIEKDKDYIIAQIVNPGKDNQAVYYYKYDYEDEITHVNPLDDPAYIRGIESSQGNMNKDKNGDLPLASYIKAVTKKSGNRLSESTAAFYNKGTGMIRIHKMVVNDFGSGAVRDDDDSILNSLTFRLTNNGTGNYIVFTTFVAKPGVTLAGRAREIDKNTKEVIATYDVTYNRGAQWTVSGIPSGTYTVEEVGDNITFRYNESSNSIEYVYDAKFSRVTKYDVTVDKEGATKYGIGGDNERVVYSLDINNHNDQGPTDVKVGDPSVGNTSHTQTVQVCNYYSSPIGPIQVTKNFTGGQWKPDMQFRFTLEPVGYTAKDSAGNPITLPGGQPMPIDGSTITLTGADASKNEDGSYTAIGSFSSIPFGFEGTYYYRLIEENTGIGGVIYDEKTEYYVEIKVEKKYTNFYKDYDGTNMANQQKYDTTSVNTEVEDLYYLGANVRYATDKGFGNVVATCELYLDFGPDTANPEKMKLQFKARYSEEDAVKNIAFNNTLSGELTVTKKWLNQEGNTDYSEHSPLTLYIWQRKAGTGKWTAYEKMPTITLSSENNWTQVVSGLLIEDADGNKYEYCIKEPDSFLATYAVSYTVNGADSFFANDAGKITVDGAEYRDPGYSLSVGQDGRDFGSVVISNTKVSTNTIPSTGGEGTAPFIALGALLLAIAFAGFMMFKKRESL